ncbi:hypothetical protein [Rhizobium leguminosarum]|uniref:hypothetical protein n=1 Tax=Rhizobium leguminosarum TaxID=384 RepID=UPI000371A82A|nr:hypothetical protein [Rhizobium leguminosarum]
MRRRGILVASCLVGWRAPSDRIDLVAIARLVAADLAPVLIASGKAIEVIVEKTPNDHGQ